MFDALPGESDCALSDSRYTPLDAPAAVAKPTDAHTRYVASIFVKHHRAVRAHLSRFLRNEDDIADTAQDVFVRLAQLDDPFRAEQSPRAYLFRIAENLVVDRIRRDSVRQVHMHLPFENDDIESSAPSVESQVNWRRAMARITTSLRDAGNQVAHVVEMSCLQDLTHNEIAEQLGVSVRTVERCMHRARNICEPYLPLS